MTKRNILVTGGGNGIGRAICLAFGSLDERVHVTDVLDKEGAETVASIREAGGTAEFFPLDVRDTGRANEVVATIEEQWGALDVVVANAGSAHRIPLDALTDVLWETRSKSTSRECGGLSVQLYTKCVPLAEAPSFASRRSWGRRWAGPSMLHIRARRPESSASFEAWRLNSVQAESALMLSRRVSFALPRPFRANTL